MADGIGLSPVTGYLLPRIFPERIRLRHNTSETPAFLALLLLLFVVFPACPKPQASTGLAPIYNKCEVKGSMIDVDLCFSFEIRSA
jgi:hypothetical protein